MLTSLFAGLALVISTSGIAASMALPVTQRTQELGIRMALGASPASLLQLVTVQGLGMTLAGLAAGMADVAALSRFLDHMLHATSTTDVVAFGRCAVPGIGGDRVSDPGLAGASD